MGELKPCLEGVGFRQVETVLNTGNVVCISPPGDALTICEEALSLSFSYSAKVILLSPAELNDCLAGFPWSDVPETSHRYIIFGDDDQILDELIQIGRPSPTERLSRGPKCLYWVVPKGETLGGEFSKLVAKAKYKKSTTTRNLNTV